MANNLNENQTPAGRKRKSGGKKTTGEEFLLSIRGSYREIVPQILEPLKESKDASRYVCEAIIEKFTREGGFSSSIFQAQQLLQQANRGGRISSPSFPENMHEGEQNVEYNKQTNKIIEELHEGEPFEQTADEHDTTPEVINDKSVVTDEKPSDEAQTVTVKSSQENTHSDFSEELNKKDIDSKDVEVNIGTNYKENEEPVKPKHRPNSLLKTMIKQGK